MKLLNSVLYTTILSIIKIRMSIVISQQDPRVLFLIDCNVKNTVVVAFPSHFDTFLHVVVINFVMTIKMLPSPCMHIQI